MAKKARNLDNVRIQPVKHLTLDLFRTLQQIFGTSYKSSHRTMSDAARKYYDVALMLDGDKMVGFVMILDNTRLEQDITRINTDNPIWAKDRPENLNRRQIELCWIHPQYRNRGLATLLYKYALANMGVTHIHIEENRVYDRIDYWRNLGFVNAMLYTVHADAQPSLRLHVATDRAYTSVYDLSHVGLGAMFSNRDMNMSLKRRQYA